METIESDRRFPFEYKLSPEASLDDYIADDLGVPLFSELVRSIINDYGYKSNRERTERA